MERVARCGSRSGKCCVSEQGIFRNCMGLDWIMDKARAGIQGVCGPRRRPLFWEPIPALRWSIDPNIESLGTAFADLGFTEIGAFRSRQREGAELIAFHFAPSHFYGVIHFPSPQEIPLELCCQLEELSGISVTNSSGLDTWHVEPQGSVVRIPNASVGDLFAALLERTAGQDREAASPEKFLKDFQSSQIRKFEELERQAMKAAEGEAPQPPKAP